MLPKEIKSFVDAIRGLFLFFATERHAKFHCIVMIIVIALGIYFNVNSTEWSFLLIAFALVIGSEMLNTSLEKLCNVVHSEKSEHIRNIKDIAAGAVFFCVLIAIIIGACIFTPKFF